MGAVVGGIRSLMPLPADSGCCAAVAGVRRGPVRNVMTVARSGRNVTVTFAPAVYQAVRRYFPGYHIARKEEYDQEVMRNVAEESSGPFVPFAVTGDFNGDGLPDVALMLTDRGGRWLLIALHQRPRGAYRPYRLNRWKVTDYWTPGTTNLSYIELCRPGKTRYPYYTAKRGVALTSMRLRHAAIEQVFPEEGSTIYYFKKGRYRAIATD